MNVDKCTICGAEATQYFASNKNLPLCGGLSCEAKLIDEINAELQAVAAEVTVKDKGEV